MNLHPKVRAALLAELGVIAATVAAWANGSMSQNAAVSAIIAGSIPVITGYLKSAPVVETANPDTDSGAGGVGEQVA